MCIPPGIQKAKERYPFNVLWGLARELLDCEILRVVGCKLGPNDWDLISLIFATRLTTSRNRPYTIEVINSPLHAEDLKKTFPYLDVRSILEVEYIVEQLVSDYLGGSPRPYVTLAPEEKELAMDVAGRGKNWFRVWLKQQAEALLVELGSVATPLGAFEKVLEGP